MQIFFSALIDAAGHAGKLDSAFEILGEAKTLGIRVGIVSYSSLMGACSNVRIVTAFSFCLIVTSMLEIFRFIEKV